MFCLCSLGLWGFCSSRPEDVAFALSSNNSVLMSKKSGEVFAHFFYLNIFFHKSL